MIAFRLDNVEIPSLEGHIRLDSQGRLVFRDSENPIWVTLSSLSDGPNYKAGLEDFALTLNPFVDVAFVTPMSTSSYSVTVSSEGASEAMVDFYVSNKTVNGFRINCSWEDFNGKVSWIAFVPKNS